MHGAAAGERLLGWLRARRQPSALACRFVFSASIGLTALLCRQRLLGWLRARRQPSALACRFVFSASIGLTALLRSKERRV
ncbi:MAG TPA: hypothetical protein DIT03_13495, partial [Candidatus Accumulibacter sp.]|nr:hypothetical protein [Accumulibacter sp.]